MYANESCDEHAVYFRRWLKWRTKFITFLLFGNDVISLKSRPLILVYLYARIQSIQKQIVEYDIKSKYTEEYLTIDKVGTRKTYSEEILFRVESHVVAKAKGSKASEFQ